ncbi:endoplasmic reticulum aminopeptidase 2 [Lepisosteus oculatus]|uniref:endoplasmic reticulum aminopeptidase 2 n=1 Tax=Lepisosteus oculatus TaxID=7918 RepID=UPI00371FDB64
MEMMMLKLAAWFQLMLVCKGSSNETMATNGQLFPWNKMRLPRSIVPNHYDLLIHPNLTTLNFTGSVTIEVDVKHSTSYVILHSKDLGITKTTIIPEEDWGSGGLGQTVRILEYPPHEQIALLAPEPLNEQRKYRLYIEFQANLADGYDGLYKSTYQTKDGEKRILAATDFEPTAARMAFPCFDEPFFKATFSIKIRREKQHIALSNMPKVRTVELAGGLLEDHFDKSVRMSTYLVAYVVCDFMSVSATTSSGIKVSVYAVPEKWNQTHYALEASVKLLEFYEHYFNISYPLPKQDLIAIPDFQSGAMENWGLITYRETALLYDPQTSSALDKLWITKVIGHELAHQWFGNLVTMEWWNDIWLNEGFARYMERVSVNNTYPEIQIEDYFLNVCFGAMSRDSLNSSHPISNPAETPVQIMEMFNTVSYDKGACILNMLKDFLTEEVFHSGIIRYLHRYSYKNAKSDDFWNTMANTCAERDFSSGGFCYTSSEAERKAHRYACQHLDLKEMMNTWTLQMGIPLITVEKRGRQVRVHQERFLKGVLQEDPEYVALQSGYLWHVPLTYSTNSSSSVRRHLLKTKSDTIQLEGEVNWIKFNVDMNGYYIVHYGEEGWDSLIELLNQNHTAISNKDRTNLIHNAIQLVSTGRLSLDRALNLTRYLKKEVDSIPLMQGVLYLNVLHYMMERRNISDTAKSLKRYILEYFKEVIDKQMWNDEGSVSDKRLRTELLELACELSYPPCVQKATQLFKEWAKSNGTKNLPTDVLRPVYAVGSQNTEDWNFLLEIYKHSLSSTDKNKILYALTRSKDTEKLNKLIQLSIEGEVIKTQNLPAVISTISRNPAGQALTWAFVRQNWGKLLEKFHLGSSAIRGILVGTTSHFSSNQELEEVRTFFASLKEQGYELKVTEVILELIQKNIRWLERNLHVLNKWLKDNIP